MEAESESVNRKKKAENTMAINKKDKRTNNDLQNRHKTKDRVTRSPLSIGGELMSPVVKQFMLYLWHPS